MRAIALSIGLVVVAVSPAANAGRPKVAVAPLDGDNDEEVSNALAEAIDSPELAVVDPRHVGKKMEKLGVDSDPDPKELRKLEKSLGVVAIINGKLGKGQHGRKQLKLEVYVHGKGGKGFTVEFKSATSKAFKKKIHDEVVSKVGTASDTDPDEDAPKPPPEEPKRRLKDTDDDTTTRRKPRDTDDDATTRRKPREETADTDERPSVRRRKKHRRDDTDDSGPNPTMTALYIGAGGAAGQRHLSFDLNKTFVGQPPTVSTGAASGRVQAELYPLALSQPNSAAAGIGLAAAYDKTVGLSIKPPGAGASVSINQSHYALGARYRFAAGNSAAIALGVDYARRSYVAEGTLDMPDVDYTAVAPAAGARVAVASSVVLFGGLDAMLILDTGGIQKNTSYGSANVYGVEGAGGVDIAFTKQIGLRVAAEVSMIMFSFRGKGDLTKNRDMDSSTVDVTGATDRSLGLAATLGIYY